MADENTDPNAELRAKVAAARARREEAEARLEAKREAEKLQDELAAEERAAAETETLEQLEEKHGPLDKAIRRVRTVHHGMIVVKKPHMATYRKFQDKQRQTSDDLEQLVKPCVVYPDRAKFEAIIADEPHALVRCADGVAYLAGIRKEDLEGK